ncbi:MAG: flagellar hook-associated protein FlgK [FCB group bacterium]|jgi:flagellar hook-associated protein 1 FlgK
MSFSSLEIGKRALMAQSIGLDVTSNNIANVNTPGYARRQVLLKETDPRKINEGFLGTGVIADTIQSYREEFFDREIRKSDAQQASYNEDEKVFQSIQSAMGEPSDSGLNEIVSNFFNAFQQVSLNPEDVATRNNLLSSAQTMVDKFHSTAQQLTDIRQGVSKDLYTDADTANQLISDIAGLNKQISTSITQSGDAANTYIDQREQKLEDLSKLAGVSVTQGDSGMVNVYVNGINMITGSSFAKLKVDENVDAVTQERTLQLSRVDPTTNTETVLSPQAGEMMSLMKHYNTTLDDKDSSNSFSLFTQLNDFANAIVTKVNGISAGGYGLDDAGPNPPGRRIFEPYPNPATASTIEISGDVLDKPRDIPIASAAGQPGDNSIALQIANIATDTTFLNGSTPSDSFTQLLGKVGQMSQDATNGKSANQLVMDQLTNQRDSVTGVNLDEEAVNLIKFQKAFEASSRVVNTTNEILTTIVNLGK